MLKEEEKYTDVDHFKYDLQMGEKRATELWNQYLKDLANGICTLSTILDQDILIGGNVVKLLRVAMPDLMRAIEEHNTRGNPFGNEIYLSDFEEDINVSAVGAALYVISHYLKDVY